MRRSTRAVLAGVLALSAVALELRAARLEGQDPLDDSDPKGRAKQVDGEADAHRVQALAELGFVIEGGGTAPDTAPEEAGA